jgi:hypothetical protein
MTERRIDVTAIHTLDDLVAHTEAFAATRPQDAHELRLRKPGCSEEDLERLRERLPGIPESYLRVAAEVTLSFVSIRGLVVVAPPRRGADDLLKRLTEVNSSASPQWEFVNAHGLYEVAYYPGSLVCVAREGTPRAGEVMRVDYAWSGTDNLPLVRTAWSFEQLLLGFGRISERFLARQFGPGVVADVLHALRSDFAFDEEQMNDWAWFVDVALGRER